MRFTRLLPVLIALAASVGPAFGQDADDTVAKIAQLSRHIASMKEVLGSTDPLVRDAAIETALQDPSAAVRGLAIYSALRRYESFSIDYDLPAGSPIRREELPAMHFTSVKWTPDGRAVGATGPLCGGAPLSGQVTGDRLRLQFGHICFSTPSVTGQASKNGVYPREVYSGCNVEMRINQAHDALTGTLVCPGAATTLPVSLPLG